MAFDLTAVLNIRASTASLGRVTRDIQGALNRVNVTGVTTGFRRATAAVEDFGRVSGLAIRRYAGFVVATSITFGLIRATTKAVSEAVKFEKQLLRVSQVTDRSVKNLGGLQREVDRLSTSLGVSSTSLISISRILSQAGLSAQETRKALQALALTELAPTFENIESTTEGAIAAMRQFNLQADDLEGVLGSLNAVAASFAVESGDIISAIRKVGSVFEAAGKQIGEGGPTERLNELIGLFTSVRATTRLSADSINAGLRTIFTRIQRPRTIAILEELGIQLTRNTEKGEEFIGAFKAIQAIAEGFDEQGIVPGTVQFARLAQEIAGVRQLKVLLPLLTQVKIATDAYNVAQDGTNSLAEDAQIALEGLGQRFDQTRERFLKFVRELVISDEFKRTADAILDLADSFIKLADSIRPILPLLSLLLAARGIAALPALGRGFARGVLPRNMGGPIQGLQQGGRSQFRNVILTPGELVVPPNQVKKIGVKNLNRLNQADNILEVPGVGNTDSVRQTLPVGSFVLRKDSVKALKERELLRRRHGGPIGFQGGGEVGANFDFSTSGINVLLTTLVGGLFLFGRGLRDTRKNLGEFQSQVAEFTPVSRRQRLAEGSLARTRLTPFETLRSRAESTVPVRPRDARGRFTARSGVVDTEIRNLRQKEVNRINTLGRIATKEARIRSKFITAEAKALRRQEALANAIPRAGLVAGFAGAAISGLPADTQAGQAAAGGLGGALTAGGIATLFGLNPAIAGTIAILGGLNGALDRLKQGIETQRLDELADATEDLSDVFAEFRKSEKDRIVTFQDVNQQTKSFVNSLVAAQEQSREARRFTTAGAPQNLFGDNETTREVQAAQSQLGISGSLGVLFQGFLDAFFRADSNRAQETTRVAAGNVRLNDIQGIISNLGDQIPNLEQAIEQQIRSGEGGRVGADALTALGSQDPDARRRAQQRFARRPDLLEQILEEEFIEPGRVAFQRLLKKVVDENLINQAVQQLDFMSERLKNIGAIAQRSGEQAAQFERGRFGIEQGLSTAPQTGRVSTRVSTLFGNLRGSSPREFQAGLANIRGITGGGFPDLEQAFGGLENLRRNFADILSRASAEPGATRAAFLEEEIVDAVGGGALGDRLRASVQEILEGGQVGRGGGPLSVEEFAREFDIAQLFNNLSTELPNTFQNVSSAFENASQSFVDALNKSAALQRFANESFATASDIRTQRQIQNIELRGGRVSAEERSLNFTRRQEELTGNIGGGLRPSFIRRAIQQTQGFVQSDTRSLNQAIERGDADDVQRFGERLNQAQERLGNLNQALQNLATSTERQSAIQNELASLEQRRSGRGNFLNQFFGGGAAGRADLLRNVVGGRLLLEGGDISARGDVAQRQLQGLEIFRGLAQQAGNADLLKQIDETSNRLLDRFGAGGLIQGAFGGIPQQQEGLLNQLGEVEGQREGANREIGRLRRGAAGAIRGNAEQEFQTRTDTLESAKLIDESFNKAAAALAASSDKLSQNLISISEQLANVNIPSEITFNGTINDGQPLVVSLAGQDSLSTQVSNEVANKVDELLRERFNERTIANTFS